MDTKSWKVRIAGKKYGPLSTSQLKTAARQGKLKPTDEVIRGDMEDWVPAGKVKGLFDEQPRPHDPGAAAPPAASPPPLADSAAARSPRQPVLAPIDGITIACRIVLFMLAMVSLISVGVVLGVLSGVLAPSIARSPVMLILVILPLLLILVFIVVVMIWTASARENTKLIRPTGLKYSTTFSVLSWIIPFVNFIVPFNMMIEMYRATEPNTPGDSWKKASAPISVQVAWLCFFAMFFARAVPRMLAASSPRSQPGNLSVVLGTVELLAMAGFAFALMSAVKAINQRQKMFVSAD